MDFATESADEKKIKLPSVSLNANWTLGKPPSVSLSVGK